MKRGTAIVIAMLAGGTTYSTDAAAVGFIKIDGSIGPATASYLARSLEVSSARRDEGLDTPLKRGAGEKK